MSKTNNSLPHRLAAALGQPKFFKFILVLLIVQAAWIALSGSYPMAFDEDFHLGIIRLYAYHLSPFWGGQPAGADTFGAVARDPSYLYQYLMSFPYRLVSFFTNDQAIQVVVLRFINIGMFAAGIPVYRRLLLKSGASRATVHTCLLVFVLLPVVPFLAAQINYDNLFIPLIGVILLVVTAFATELTGKKRVNAGLLFAIAILCLLASLVKYAFLPLFAAVVAYLAWEILRAPFPNRWRSFLSELARLGRRQAMFLILLSALATGLFIQRYGVNLVRYHNPVPGCDRILSVKQCSQYGPWIRDYNFAINKIGNAHGPVSYTRDWGYGMWLRTFFTLGGPQTDYETRGPLLVPASVSIVMAAISVLVLAVFARRVWRNYNAPVLWLLTLATVLYCAVLWYDDYHAYTRTQQPVAINGRYLFPVLPLVFVIVALAYGQALKRLPNLKLALAGISVAGLLWGGGALTFILRSQDYWYWPDPTVRAANHAIKRTLGPVTPGYQQPTQFLR